MHVWDGYVRLPLLILVSVLLIICPLQKLIAPHFFRNLYVIESLCYPFFVLLESVN